MREERRERVVFGLLVLAVVVPRLFLSACVSDFGADGSFYTDVARNVRDGHGLATDVSVFHHGFPSFPHPTSTYPLWPLIFGFLAKIVPLETVGVWVPTALYFVAVGLAYAVGRRLSPHRLFAGLPVHGGHVFAVLIALNVEFAIATSRPFTEGVAFTLLFGLLLRARVLWRSLGLLAGLELGLWLVALFLTRSQFVVIGIAALVTMPVALFRRPREAALFLVGTAITTTAIWQLYAHWLGTFLPHPSLGTYLRLDLARVGDQLSVVPFLVEPRSLFARGVDLLSGVGWAFSLNDDISYQALHHGSAWALPIAAIVLATRWRRAPVVWRFLRGPGGANAAFFHLVALALTASLHTVHQIYGEEWVFGSRLGIPSVLLVGMAILYLLRSGGRIGRAAAIFVLAAGLYGSWTELVGRTDDQCRSRFAGKSLGSYRAGLREWLLSERERLGSLTVAVERPEAQMLSWRTPGVGFHWLTESTTVGDLGVMVSTLGVRYVVVFDEVKNVRFTNDPLFETRFVAVPFGEAEGRDERAQRARTRVYAPRCSAFPELPACVDDTR